MSRVPCPVSRVAGASNSNRLDFSPARCSESPGYTHTYVHTVSAQHLKQVIISSHRINPAIAKERPDMDHACNVLVVVVGRQSVSHVRHREVSERERQNTLFNFNHPFCVAILDAPTVFHNLLLTVTATQREV